MMKRMTTRLLAGLLAAVMMLALCACGSKEPEVLQRGSTWYLGGDKLFSSDENEVKAYFTDYTDTVDPAAIYQGLTYTTKMLRGAYMLNYMEYDVTTVRNDIPFEEIQFHNGPISTAILPVAVFLGSEHICCSETGYGYAAFDNYEGDVELAVLKLATPDQLGTVLCTYSIEGNQMHFKQILQTSKDDEAPEFEYSGVEFTFGFSVAGPDLTLTKNDSELTLRAYAFTSNHKNELSMTGYSLPDSPLVGELDYFASSDSWNYAVRRDGSYYDVAAYKLTADGRITICLAEKSMVVGQEDVVEYYQFAYIVQSEASNFLPDFRIILLDGQTEYYYTDDLTMREARVLKDQGTDVSGLTEDQIKQIAEKKADLFDDLQAEFEAQGIAVTINRSTGEIMMDASVLFGGDSAQITDSGKALLDKFMAAYTAIAMGEKYEGFIAKTVVEGHTAPLQGSTYESGLPLSQERAQNVLAYCMSIGAEAGAMEAVGLSNSKPLYGADGKIDLNACRRVSFRLVVNLDAVS